MVERTDQGRPEFLELFVDLLLEVFEGDVQLDVAQLIEVGDL